MTGAELDIVLMRIQKQERLTQEQIAEKADLNRSNLNTIVRSEEKRHKEVAHRTLLKLTLAFPEYFDSPRTYAPIEKTNKLAVGAETIPGLIEEPDEGVWAKSIRPQPSVIPETPEPSYIQKRRQMKIAEKLELPVYVGNTRAGRIEVYSDDPEAQTPVAFLPASLFPSCNHAERVTGNSMYPRIVNQGYVVGKVVDKSGTLAPGEIYGVHFNGQAVVKYLHPQKDGNYLLISDNKEVPPFTVAVDEVTFLFRVYFILNPA